MFHQSVAQHRNGRRHQHQPGMPADSGLRFFDAHRLAGQRPARPHRPPIPSGIRFRLRGTRHPQRLPGRFRSLHLPRLQQTGRGRHVQQRPRRCQISAHPRVATPRRPGEDPVFRRRFPLQAPRRHRRVRLDPPALPHQTQTAGRASRGPKRPFRMQTGARPGHQSQSQVVQERMPSHHRLTIPAHPRFRIRRFGHYRTHRRRFRCLHLPGSERRGRRRNDHQLLVQIVQADRDVQRDGLGMDKLQYLEDKSKYQRAEESEEVCTQVVKLKKTVRFRLFNPNVWPAGNYNNKNFVDFFNFLIT